MHTRLAAFLCWCLLILLAVGCARTPPTDPQAATAGAVTLSLASARAEHLQNEVLFVCDAVLDNRTGAELTVRSCYFSAFDGLDLVVMDEMGHTVARQAYTFHQSFFSIEQQCFPLKGGQNQQELRFPVRGLPKNRIVYRVLLAGHLPGSEYDGSLSSNQVAVVPLRCTAWP
jgi:hypothetical protein